MMYVARATALSLGILVLSVNIKPLLITTLIHFIMVNSPLHACLKGWWGSPEVTACGLGSGTETGTPDISSVSLVGKTRLRVTGELTRRCAAASSMPFDLLTTLVKRNFQLYLSVENFLVIRRSHWQEDMWNSILGPYLEPILGIYN